MCVALRKESVDRNICYLDNIEITQAVALRKESVDRNLHSRNGHNVNRKVALRKESVDRNFYYSNKDADWVRSLSARRAWIEIHVRCFCPAGCWVALRKESVDRNCELPSKAGEFLSRSPQGERG